ncbi:hypothetical protein [Zunongwangia mangrovi]|nr:hypothetical protein [Zunongwangia mangrovi]
MAIIKKILNELLALLTIFNLFYFDLFSSMPDLELNLIILFLAMMGIVILMEYFEFKKRNSDPFVYLRTNNDQYSQITRFIFGGLVISGTIVCSLMTDININFLFLVFVIGISTFTRGFFPVKTTKIKLVNPALVIDHLGKNYTLKMNSISGIKITENEIVFNLEPNQKHTVGFLALSETDIIKIKDILKLPIEK